MTHKKKNDYRFSGLTIQLIGAGLAVVGLVLIFATGHSLAGSNGIALVLYLGLVLFIIGSIRVIIEGRARRRRTDSEVKK